MTTYLIVDDEPIAHDIIKGYCDLLPGMQLMANCYDAIEALSHLRENKVDLIFLDLNMPKLKGFDFLKTLSNPPKVIVTTAYQEYALEGYELNVIDYLLKPFSFERFLKAIHKAFDAMERHEMNSVIASDTKEDSLFLRSNKKYHQVALRKILFLESAGNYVKVVTIDQVIPVRAKISDLLKKIETDSFLRVHKSFAIAKAHIRSIEGNRIFINKYQVPIGKLYKSEINRLLRE